MPNLPQLFRARATGSAGWRRWVVLAALLLPAALAACSSDEGPPPPCPAVSAVTGASNLVRFNRRGQDLTDVLFEANIRGAALSCVYTGDTIEAEMRVSIEAMRGPAELAGKVNLSYFVAVATRGREILAREEFDLEVPFSGNRTRVAAVEEISQRIPLKAGEDGADYVIYVGLALTPRELEYNLSNR